MKYQDYYQILGVTRDASGADIKKSYRKLARKYHPDVSKDAAAEDKFKEVNEAYDVLKDAEKRAAYDRFGSDWKHGHEFNPGGYSGGFAGGDFSDFFESIFGGGSQQQRPGIPEMKKLKINIPRGVSNGQKIRLGKQGEPAPDGGEAGDLYLEMNILPHRYFKLDNNDVILRLPVTPWEAAVGTTLKVPTLGGEVELKIKPGMQSGQKMRLKGKGMCGREQGDQFVEVMIQTPPADSKQAEQFYGEMEKQFDFNPRQF